MSIVATGPTARRSVALPRERWDARPGAEVTALLMARALTAAASALGTSPQELMRRIQEERRAAPGCAMAEAVARAVAVRT